MLRDQPVPGQVLRAERGPERPEMLIINLAVGSHVRVHIISVFWSSGKLFSALACPYSFFFFLLQTGVGTVCVGGSGGRESIGYSSIPGKMLIPVFKYIG